MRQAVLLIHGIGEQRPMSTLRPFAEAVLPEQPHGAEKYWSKPDPLAGTMEVRRLVTHRRLATDLFEYYWAHHAEGTTFKEVLAWLASLILRRKQDVPGHLRPLWRLSRALGLIILGLVLAGAASWAKSFTGTPVWFAGAGLATLLQWWVVRYLGDAARYLSPKPGNITLRQKIREDGVHILRELHESRSYDRIVVVGHSLGSVIAYDIITFLWQEYHAMHLDPKRMDQPEIRNISRIGKSLSADKQADAERFQAAQARLWLEQRRISNPWRVTDLITLGSPLAHAMLLMADGAEDFERRKRQRELPTCPPVLDGNTYCYWRRPPYERDGLKISLSVLHHAAAFAVTRWTNLFFPAHLGFFGDLVGGKLGPVLGPGIRDIDVTTAKWKGFGRFSLASHVLYWWKSPSSSLSREQRPNDALTVLRQTLGLNRLKEYAFAPDESTQPSLNSSEPDQA